MNAISDPMMVMKPSVPGTNMANQSPVLLATKRPFLRVLQAGLISSHYACHSNVYSAIQVALTFMVGFRPQLIQ